MGTKNDLEMATLLRLLVVAVLCCMVLAGCVTRSPSINPNPDPPGSPIPGLPDDPVTDPPDDPVIDPPDDPVTDPPDDPPIDPPDEPVPDPLDDSVWSTYGHDSSRAGYSPATGPSQLNLLDYFELDHTINGFAPVSVGPYCIVVGQSLHCVDENGDVLWHYKPPVGIDGNPAVSADGTIYVMDFNGGLHSLNPDGSIQWILPGIDLALWDWQAMRGYTFPFRDRIVLAGDGNIIYTMNSVYEPSECSLICVNPAGDVIWERDFPFWISPPQLGPQGLLLRTRQSHVRAIDILGNDIWDVPYTGGDYWPQMKVQFAVGADGSVAYTEFSSLFVQDPDGSLLWSKTDFIATIFNATPAFSPDGRLFIADMRELQCYSPQGEWQWSIPDGIDFYSTPLALENGGIAANGETGLVVYSSDGDEEWSYDPNNELQDFKASIRVDSLGRIHFASLNNYAVIGPAQDIQFDYWVPDRYFRGPVIDSANVFYVTSGRLAYGVNLEGEILWRYCHDSELAGPVIGSNEDILFTAADGGLHALNNAGEFRWSYFPTEKADYPTVAADGSIYLTTDSSTIYALDADGDPKWEFDTGSTPGLISLGPEGFLYTITGSGELLSLTPEGEPNWVSTTGFPWQNSALVVGTEGVVYALKYNTLFSFSPTGEEVGQIEGEWWGPGFSISLPGNLFTTFSGHYLWPASTRSSSQLENGGVYSFTAAGELLWHNESISQYYGKIVVDAEGKCFVGGSGAGILCFDSNGEKLWTFSPYNYWKEGSNLFRQPSVVVPGPPSLALAPNGTLLAQSSWGFDPDGGDDDGRNIVLFFGE